MLNKYYCKKYTKLFFLLLAVLKIESVSAQLLTWSPDFLKEQNASSIVITADANKGNMGLLNYTPTSDVYVHIGAITTKSTGPNDWKYVLSTWGTTVATYNATSLGSNKWSFTLPANLRAYFGITDTTESITHIAILFRSGSGNNKLANSDNSDMYIPVSNDTSLKIKLIQPPSEPRFTPWLEPISLSVGQPITVEASTNKNANISFDINAINFANCNNVQICNSNYTILQACYNSLAVKANTSSESDSAQFSFFVNTGSAVQLPLPANVQDGINYEAGDTSVVLVLYAPNKTNAIVLGDFNNFLPDCSYSMNQTPDSLRFWKRITGLTPNKIHQFQYLVDGTILTNDPYTELVLDPWNDNGISDTTFPNMPLYPVGQTSGMVSTLQTAQVPFVFSSFVRPAKENLIVYECLLRDFLSSHDYNTLKDTLPYLKKLGINCIELMPINEFEGNNSWGYNPSFHFALDKYYGTKLAFQQFVEEAHQQGIAVVVDAVLNHITGLSPLAQLYWNNSLNQASANNPWLNDTATHPFNVFNDMNHESQATKYYTERYIRHWLTTYNIDGFRWDLSKGFTQIDYGGNVGAWSALDTTRVKIWKRYYDSMQAVSPGSYCILEHLGVDAEESQLANYGMLLWGIMNYEYNQNSMGFSSSSSINRAYTFKRTGFTKMGIITYAESHDEERMMYRNLNNGNSSGTYNIKNLNTALKRQEAIAPFLYLLPGPKMIWEFGEVGYDFSINRCVNGTVNSACRLDPKPIKWDYLQIATRKRLYEVTSALLNLRQKMPSTFSENSLDNASSDLGSALTKKFVLKDTNFNLVCIGNFDVSAKSVSVTFPHTGLWYNYITGTTLNVSSVSQTFNLTAGEYNVFIDSNITGGNVFTSIENNILEKDFVLHPNPSSSSFHIISFQNEDLEHEIIVYNTQMSVVAKYKVKNAELDNTNFDISNLNTGNYWVFVKNKKGVKMLRMLKI